MSRSALVRKDLFDEWSQVLLGVEASQLRPMGDRLVVRDLPEKEQREICGDESLELLPEHIRGNGISENGNRRVGIVVAAGRGDSTIDKVIPGEMTPEGRPKLRRISVKCQVCKGEEPKPAYPTGWSIPVSYDASNHRLVCSACNGSGTGRAPMDVKVGDMILYERRRDLEFTVEGQMYTLCNSEQSALAILE